MGAPTNPAKREESSCQLGAVHTWGRSRSGVSGPVGPLLTHFGSQRRQRYFHRSGPRRLPSIEFGPLHCRVLIHGGGYETTRFHIRGRRRGAVFKRSARTAESTNHTTLNHEETYSAGGSLHESGRDESRSCHQTVLRRIETVWLCRGRKPNCRAILGRGATGAVRLSRSRGRRYKAGFDLDRGNSANSPVQGSYEHDSDCHLHWRSYSFWNRIKYCAAGGQHHGRQR